MIDLPMEKTLVIGVLLAVTGLVMAVATTAIWGFSGAGELRGSNALVAGMALLIGGLQLIAVSWCRAMVDVTVLTEQTSFSDIQLAPLRAVKAA
jgi:hypothetical protein